MARASVDRLSAAIRESTLGAVFAIGVTPDTLMILNKPDKLTKDEFVMDASGAFIEEPVLANTWERDGRGEHPHAVVETVDPESIDINPLTYL
jgi:hypothetical protein